MALSISEAAKLRVLIISSDDIFRQNNSVSLTTRSIFSGFPKENISQIVCEDINGRNTGLVDSKTFVVGHDSIRIGKLMPPNREVKTNLHSPSGIGKKRKTLKAYFYQLASAIYQNLPYKLDGRIDAFIKDNAPQIIYTVLTPSRNNALAYQIARKYQLPIVPHFYDDWQMVYLTESIWLKPVRWYFNTTLKQLLNRSSLCLCISEKMCKEYSTRFRGHKFIPLMHSVEDLALVEKTNSNDHIQMIYSGSLYLGRNDSLRMLCEVIRELGRNDIYLDIYCPNEQKLEVLSEYENFPFVSFKGLIPQKEMFRALRQADFLLFLESFSSDYLVYTSFSLSTKIPEYLSSCVPILALGNKNQGSIEYLLKEKAAYVATEESEIKKVCEDAFSYVDKDIIIQNSRRVYEKHHSKAVNSQLILDIFSNSTVV